MHFQISFQCFVVEHLPLVGLMVCHLEDHLSLVVGLCKMDDLEVDLVLNLVVVLLSLVVVHLALLVLVVLLILVVVLFHLHLEASILPLEASILPLASMAYFPFSSAWHQPLTRPQVHCLQPYLLKYLDLSEAP